MRARVLPPNTVKMGLRFQRKDAHQLRVLAQRVIAGDLRGHALSTFSVAADAAEQGEPLEVECRDPMEAHLMAHGYSLWGIRQPTVEQLNT